jgi:hypothetical protein
MAMQELQGRSKAEHSDVPPGLLERKASFSELEAFILHRLLVDDDAPATAAETIDSRPSTSSQLDDEVLFSVPPAPMLNVHLNLERPSLIGLWKAHAEGVAPKDLVSKGHLSFPVNPKPEPTFEETTIAGLVQKLKHEDSHDETDNSTSTHSDIEVRPSSKEEDSHGSWDESDHVDHYDAWEVLRDEYAEDFGFDYNPRQASVEDILNAEDGTAPHTFSILGTSADDTAAQPHVLSPPLMDAIMNFLPQVLHDENYWLKYSLVRDGANLETLKKYSKGSRYTVMAIETPKGEVFGSFTSRSWRHHPSYFGASPAFVWKMRHNRRTKCHALFDQAQLESEIDVYMLANDNDFVQVCRQDQLAVGGDTATTKSTGDTETVPSSEKATDSGFAIALDEDLVTGSTSPCAAFRSPSLCGSGIETEIFEVANLEIWTFTPMSDETSAQKLEMTKFFVGASVRSNLSSRNSSIRGEVNPTEFKSVDLLREKFYERLGQDTEGDERRQRWQVSNMWNSLDSSRAFGASPRFGYNT